MNDENDRALTLLEVAMGSGWSLGFCYYDPNAEQYRAQVKRFIKATVKNKSRRVTETQDGYGSTIAASILKACELAMTEEES